MNILALDTSTQHFSLAVTKDEKTLHSRSILLKKVLSDSIMPAIEGILKKSGLTLAKIDGFAVGLGPGSFTSLRVGLATVKGLAFATKKPVVGIPSLDVLAMNVEPHFVGRNPERRPSTKLRPSRRINGDGQVCVLCDAKRKLVYSCLYEKKGAVLKRKSRYLLTDIENVLQRIKGEVIFVGDGVPLFRETIEGALGTKAHFVGEKQIYPQARHLAALALKRFESKEYDVTENLVPLYLYPEDCQVVRR